MVRDGTWNVIKEFRLTGTFRNINGLLKGQQRLMTEFHRDDVKPPNDPHRIEYTI